ncbi:MAG TPA: helix-turn-helix domain-containing protein, partial [Gemmatales bacterium]|nr:helix-turn-helix domain-containing protein [Gemmatales bacterium]
METNLPSYWTLAELTAEVALHLSQEGTRQTSGRVNDVPDQRTIRYYPTKGLLSPPVTFRGRTALYSHIHLYQLLAIKRLQAKGLPLVEVQQRLLGAEEHQLRDLAGPSTLSAQATSIEPSLAAAAPPVVEPAFWKTEPAKHPCSEPPAHRTHVTLMPGLELCLEGIHELDTYDVAALRQA